MPRKKVVAAPQPSLNETNGTFSTSVDNDTSGADVSSLSQSGGRSNSSSAGGQGQGQGQGQGRGEKQPPQGGILTESMQKQMAIEGIEAFELPRAVVTRLAKAELPDPVQIRKDAILAISKSATIFISYLAAVADELAKQASRKTIATSDVLNGLSLMEFPEQVRERVKKELKSYRALQEQTKKEKQKASGSTSEAVLGDGVEDGEEEEEEEDDDDDGGRTTLPKEGDEEQASGTFGEGGEMPAARPSGRQDLDEEDEDIEQRVVGKGTDDGEDDEEDEEMGDEEG